MTLKSIQLAGRLANEFGDSFELEVLSPAEAVRALCIQIPRFEEVLRSGEYRVSIIRDETLEDIGEEELEITFGKATGMRIEPVVGGSKKGLGKLIAGIALIGVAFYTGGASLGGGLSGSSSLLGAATVAGIPAAKIATFGTMMALQGASMLLSPTPSAPQRAEENESYLLDGAGNFVEQGNPVPTAYGEVFAGSVVISAGITTDEMAVYDNEPLIDSASPATTSQETRWDV